MGSIRRKTTREYREKLLIKTASPEYSAWESGWKPILNGFSRHKHPPSSSPRPSSYCADTLSGYATIDVIAFLGILFTKDLGGNKLLRSFNHTGRQHDPTVPPRKYSEYTHNYNRKKKIYQFDYKYSKSLKTKTPIQ